MRIMLMIAVATMTTACSTAERTDRVDVRELWHGTVIEITVIKDPVTGVTCFRGWTGINCFTKDQLGPK